MPTRTTDAATDTAADIDRVAVLGAGVIGASWTALFLAAGCSVAVYDPADGHADQVRDAVETAWPALLALGLATTAGPPAADSVDTPEAAVAGAGFIQESVPENLDMKHALYRRIEPALAPEAVVASSASGLLVRDMQDGWRNPARFLLGHPFNPPHLIPLVELLGNDRTDPGALDRAQAFYRRCGKVTIRVQREVPGHVANRLQAALWREAIHLVAEGVATVADVDKAVWAGPGLRWAAMGPHMLFHLGAGPGGMAAFCARYGDSFHRWWDSLGTPRLDAATAEQIARGVADEAAGRTLADLAADRDALILAMLRDTARLRAG